MADVIKIQKLLDESRDLLHEALSDAGEMRDDAFESMGEYGPKKELMRAHEACCDLVERISECIDKITSTLRSMMPTSDDDIIVRQKNSISYHLDSNTLMRQLKPLTDPEQIKTRPERESAGHMDISMLTPVKDGC